jgi:hypothetical protein
MGICLQERPVVSETGLDGLFEERVLSIDGLPQCAINIAQ